MYRKKYLPFFILLVSLVLVSCGNKIPTVDIVEVTNSLPPSSEKDVSDYFDAIDEDYDFFVNFPEAEEISQSEKEIIDIVNSGRVSNVSPNHLYSGRIHIDGNDESGKIEKIEDGKSSDVFFLDFSLMGRNIEHDIDKVAAGDNLFVFHSDYAEYKDLYYLTEHSDFLIPVININGEWHQCRMISPESDYSNLEVFHIAEDGKSFSAFSEKNGKAVVFRYVYNESQNAFNGKMVFSGGPSAFGKTYKFTNYVTASPSFEYVTFVFRNDDKTNITSSEFDEFIIQIYRVENDRWVLAKELSHFDKYYTYVSGFYQDEKYMIVEGLDLTSIYSVKEDFKKIFESSSIYNTVIKDDCLYFYINGQTKKFNLLTNVVERTVIDPCRRPYIKFSEDESLLLVEKILFNVEKGCIKPLEYKFSNPFLSDDGLTIVDAEEIQDGLYRVDIYRKNGDVFSIEENHEIEASSVNDVQLMNDGSIVINERIIISKGNVSVREDKIIVADSGDFLLSKNNNAVTVSDISGNPLYKIPVKGQDIEYFDGNYLLSAGPYSDGFLYLYRKIDDNTWSEEAIPLPSKDISFSSFEKIRGQELIIATKSNRVLVYDISNESTTLENWYQLGLNRKIYCSDISTDGSVLVTFSINYGILEIFSNYEKTREGE